MYFVSAIIPFRYYENVPNTDTNVIIVSRSQKASGWHIQSVTQHKTLLKKKRTLLDKITSLQKYKQEGLKQGLKQKSFVCSSLKINEQVNELCEGKINWKKQNKKKTTTKQRERERERVLDKTLRLLALARNRTRASCVAGENSTFEPLVPFDGVPSVFTKKIA